MARQVTPDEFFKPRIQDLMTEVIKYTEDPTSTLKLEQAYSSVKRLGLALAPKADHDTAMSMVNKLMSVYTDDELDEIAPTPSFILACISLLEQSLIRFPAYCKKENTK